PPARGHVDYAAPDLGQRERGDVEVVVALRLEPGQERGGGGGLDDVADDVGVEQVAGQSSTLRPSSRGRTRSSPAPPSGERRSAAAMPPRFGFSPAIVRLTVARMRAASSPPSARRRASERISSRSDSRPTTSNRLRPRASRRER